MQSQCIFERPSQFDTLHFFSAIRLNIEKFFDNFHPFEYYCKLCGKMQLDTMKMHTYAINVSNKLEYVWDGHA